MDALLHQTYSPDITPYYNLFKSLERSLDKNFNSLEVCKKTLSLIHPPEKRKVLRGWNNEAAL